MAHQGSFQSIPLGAGRIAARPQQSDGVAENYLTDEFPAELLKMTLGMLPASYRFVAPVSRKLRDLYDEVRETEKKKKNCTYRYSIKSEAALQQYLDDKEVFRKIHTSLIGAGCGRTDWVERGGVFNLSTCSTAARGGQLGV
eukprot:CAMPEP_0194270242 /NCGR_PEP_ID=MMETSP0169-20130528/4270_1 /TAXON_ID=218684 /ORGANISM="Corethron pennatum, Strain L29A3" /LENGTH=141 /DNA_ID=CAMNT_0039012215 /DNA_START=166 /DNA_END=588 /DNA_ORIENTATION=+